MPDRREPELDSSAIARYGRLEFVLSDGQRRAWRPGDAARWSLVRELHRRLPVAPAIWAVATTSGDGPGSPNAAVGPPSVSLRVLTPGLPMTVRTAIENTGPGTTTRSAGLWTDGRRSPVPAQTVGPIAACGRVTATFHAAIATPGSHVLVVRLDGLDPLGLDDESSLPVDVTPALPELLVDGAPGSEPFRGATDFLRAALSPSGDETPQVRARVITADRFAPEALRDCRAIVLAGVERISTALEAAVAGLIEDRGGVLVLSGRRIDVRSWSTASRMPARLGDVVGGPSARKPIAHPAPRTFTGPVMAPFAEGDDPALAGADLFAYRRLVPVPVGAVPARLDTGDPWMVERVDGRGPVVVFAAPFDADHGTLPVNRDFVPMAHELILGLAGGPSSRLFAPGEPVFFRLAAPPPPDVDRLTVATPGDGKVLAAVIREVQTAQARVDDASEAGIYRMALPDPPGGSAHAAVAGDPLESDLTPLDPAEAANIARGWPLEFAPGPDRLEAALAAPAPGGRCAIGKALILVALGSSAPRSS